jgi:hypothetical protein
VDEQPYCRRPQLGNTGTELYIYIMYIVGCYFQPCHLYEIIFPTKNMAELFLLLRAMQSLPNCSIHKTDVSPSRIFWRVLLHPILLTRKTYVGEGGIIGTSGRGLSILGTRLTLRKEARGVISQAVFIRHTAIHEATWNKYEVFVSYFIICIRMVQKSWYTLVFKSYLVQMSAELRLSSPRFLCFIFSSSRWVSWQNLVTDYDRILSNPYIFSIHNHLIPHYIT